MDFFLLSDDAHCVDPEGATFVRERRYYRYFGLVVNDMYCNLSK
jgi:hypothetical protein